MEISAADLSRNRPSSVSLGGGRNAQASLTPRMVTHRGVNVDAPRRRPAAYRTYRRPRSPRAPSVRARRPPRISSSGDLADSDTCIGAPDPAGPSKLPAPTFISIEDWNVTNLTTPSG